MSRPTILLGESFFADSARRLLEEVGDVLDFGDRATFDERLPRADALVVGLEIMLPGSLLARATRLRVIASRTSGLGHIDVDEASRRGIAVLSHDADAPTLRATSSTAELTMALLFSLVRNIPWAFDSLKAGRWERARYGGHELRGKSLGILGFGRLGQMVAGYGQAFGMVVLATDRVEKREEIEALGVTPADLEQLLTESDVLSVHCTLTDETRGMIGKTQLESMRPGAMLLNAARGEIVDETALLDALESGSIAGAAIDTLAGEQPDGAHVRDNPLVEYARTHENLIVVPHLGGATIEATERTQLYISRRLVAWLESND